MKKPCFNWFLFHFCFLSTSLFFLFSSACSHFGEVGEPFYSKVYEANLEQIWPVVLKSLSDYPIKIYSKDTGKIQSEILNRPYNDLVFELPEFLEIPEQFRYSLRFHIAAIDNNDSDEEEDPDDPSIPQLTRVRIIKDLEKYYDFYTGWLPYPSDGIEEKVLLYRIQQILEIQKRLTQPKSKTKS